MLHGHLIPDDQVDLDEQTMQVRLPRDVARTLLTRGEWDLEFGVRGPGEVWRNARGYHANLHGTTTHPAVRLSAWR